MPVMGLGSLLHVCFSSAWIGLDAMQRILKAVVLCSFAACILLITKADAQDIDVQQAALFEAECRRAAMAEVNENWRRKARTGRRMTANELFPEWDDHGMLTSCLENFKVGNSRLVFNVNIHGVTPVVRDQLLRIAKRTCRVPEFGHLLVRLDRDEKEDLVRQFFHSTINRDGFFAYAIDVKLSISESGDFEKYMIRIYRLA